MTISRAIRGSAAAFLLAAALCPAPAAASPQPTDDTKWCTANCSVGGALCLQTNSETYCAGWTLGCLVGCNYNH